MGFLRAVAESAIITTVLILFLAYSPLFLDCNPSLPSVSLPKKLEGPLAVNNKLNKAEILLEGLVQWPESMAVHDGAIYTGVHDGNILRIEGSKITTIVRTGEDCEGQWQEPVCGRPLGVRFHEDGHLYVADAYHGMFKINVQKGTKEVILPSSTEVGGKRILFMNDLVFGPDGTIYFTQSSTKWNLTDVIYSLLEHDMTGRLFSFDPKSKKVTLLVDDLKLANGIELSRDGKRLLIAESVGLQVRQYMLEGPNKGKVSVFVGDLPGEVDNIRRSPRGGYWLGINAARTIYNPTLADQLGPYPMARKVIMRLLHSTGKLLTFVAQYIPSPAFKELAFNAVTARFLVDVTPAHGTIIRVDEEGKVVESLHSPDGKIAHISEVLEHDGHLYIGSWRNKFLGRLKV